MNRFFSLRLGWLFAAGAIAVPMQKAAAEITREFNEIYRVGEEHRLVIDAEDAEVAVTGVDRGDISLRMVWNAQTDDADQAEERFNRVQFTAREDGNATILKIRTQRQGWFHWGRRKGPKIHMELQVPSHLPLNIDLTSGDLVVRGVAGDHAIDTVSADLRLENCAGDIRADSTSGGIVFVGCPGNHTVDTISGDVRIEGGAGNVAAESISGAIRILDFPGAHRAESVSGNIEASLGSGLRENLRFESVSGHIAILVPAGLVAQFELETISGGLRFEVPGAEIERQHKRAVSARVGTGEHRIHLETISGEISVRLDPARS